MSIGPPPTTTHRRARWIDAAVVLLLCLLSVAFYRHIALSNRILAGMDAYTYFYPYRAYAASTLRSGRIPLWNPYLFLGVPFLANAQAAVYYPLNVLLLGLSAPKLVAWSIVMHAAIAAACAYLYARRSLRLAPAPAALGAVAFALGGYLCGQVEHVNQLNVAAWFPLLLLLWDQRAHRRWRPVLGIGAVIGLGLLAGHTQTTYISLLGLSLYALLPVVADAVRALRHRQVDRAAGRALLGHAWSVARDLAIAGTAGAALAAAQLLPTLELSRYSIRSGGLPYRQAVSFSLRPLPRLLRYTFLPPWGGNLVDVFGGAYYTEFLAYLGLTPLLLAAMWAILAVWRRRRDVPQDEGASASPHSARLLALACAGPFLALGLYNPAYFVLYKVLPGFGLFRVPARWLFLYAFAAAMIAALGAQRAVDWLRARMRPARARWAHLLGWLLVAVTFGELVCAAEALPVSHPTAPEALSSLRTAPAHILAAQQRDIAPGRFLSMSDILFDPGDLAEMRDIFAGQLSEGELYDYVVAAKRKEILAPNLPLYWRIYAVDGYDGGLLPLARYVQLQRLFLDEDEILSDGRLREGLEDVPPGRLLSLLGAQYVITDKVHDAWIDDVFYDLAFEALLGTDATPTVTSGARTPFEATGVGLISYLEGAGALPDGTPVGQIDLIAADGSEQSYVLRAGQDTAEGLYDGTVRHAQAQVGRAWRDRPEGSHYVARLRWANPLPVVRVRVTVLAAPHVRLHVRGCTLIDERDGSNVPVLLSTAGDYRQVHSGDVKIYELSDALPRAYVVHHTTVVPDDEAALAALADPDFDPAQRAILAGTSLSTRPYAPRGDEAGDDTPTSSARVTTYAPERVTVEVDAGAPGYLVLSDAWYPGWRATVDGTPAPVERANLLFRAVPVPAGTHTIELAYRPLSAYAGAAISAAALLALLILALRSRQRGQEMG